MGPKGMIHLERGVIRHQRHVHMCQREADHYGVKDGDFLNLRVASDCPAVLEEVLVRVSAGAKLEVHIDTDEGNAVNWARSEWGWKKVWIGGGVSGRSWQTEVIHVGG